MADFTPSRIAAALLAAGLACVAVPAGAADLDEGWGGPPRPPIDGFDRGPPLPPPTYGPPPARFVAAPPPPPCRMIVRRHFDAFGDEIIRRVRVCDGPPDGFGPPGSFEPSWRRPAW